MAIKIIRNCSEVDWNEVRSLLKSVNMGYYPSKIHKTAFENSKDVVFIYDGKKLVASGRMISDGAYQGAIYDVAVMEEYQGRGLGRVVIENLLCGNEKLNIILYATPGKEAFYRKLDFRSAKTAMAKFVDADSMSLKGFTD